MVLTETEEMLVIIAGAIVLMALISNILKDYRSMSREAKKEITQREKDEAYVKELKRVIDQKNEELQRQIEEKDKL
jgi:beta-lactamase regulating signal transducer with metallopeptidase domain